MRVVLVADDGKMHTIENVLGGAIGPDTDSEGRDGATPIALEDAGGSIMFCDMEKAKRPSAMAALKTAFRTVLERD
jgi:hypothetical protein